MPQTPWYPLHSLRENSKNKYATSLVDQAAKSLCKIWRPRGIPLVFLTSSRVTVGSEQQASLPPKSRRRNTQWPSPHSLPVSCLGPSVAERVRAAHDGADSLLVLYPAQNWLYLGHPRDDIQACLATRMLSGGRSGVWWPNACALSTSTPTSRRIGPPTQKHLYLGCYLEAFLSTHCRTRARCPRQLRRDVGSALGPKALVLISDAILRVFRCFSSPAAERVRAGHVSPDVPPDRPPTQKHLYLGHPREGVLKAMATRFGIPAAAHTHADVVGADSPPDRMRHRT
ncbi:hypothetical protein B0H14DRAFT_3144040 [Mycena olivaceomarginata]|nr:hypothetical protein B0H14DRAFT_3144040 [Mycena olivaceomarginata]